MSLKTCLCCGQIIPPAIVLPPIRQRIYDAVRRRPRTADELRSIAWRDDPDCGPATWKTIYAHVYLLNRSLRQHGLAVRRPWRVAHEPYRLVPFA